VYRRLGDVALFLSGVFPDYVAARVLGPLDASRSSSDAVAGSVTVWPALWS
jgi:hypothetical protein